MPFRSSEYDAGHRIELLATLGPASLISDTVVRLAAKGVTLFRVNMSHASADDLRKAVEIVGEDRVQGFETFGFAVQALITGDVCAVFIDETAGQGYLGENAESVMLVGPSLSSDELGFIFPLDSEYVDAFNYAIDFMKADGSAETLAQKYFGDAFTISYDDITFPE